MLDARKKSFIAVLYTEMKFVNRSRKRVIKTSANRTWERPEMPAHDLVFQILRRRMTIAARWEMSPASLKMFMLSPCLCWSCSVPIPQTDVAVRQVGVKLFTLIHCAGAHNWTWHTKAFAHTAILLKCYTQAV